MLQGCPSWLRGRCRFWGRSWPVVGVWQGLRTLSANSREAEERNCTVSKASRLSWWAWPAPPPRLSPPWSLGHCCMRALRFTHSSTSRNTDDPRRPSRGRLCWLGLLGSHIASWTRGIPSWILRSYLSLSSTIDCCWRWAEVCMARWNSCSCRRQNLCWHWVRQGCLCPQKWRSPNVPYHNTLRGVSQYLPKRTGNSTSARWGRGFHLLLSPQIRTFDHHRRQTHCLHHRQALLLLEQAPLSQHSTDIACIFRNQLHQLPLGAAPPGRLFLSLRYILICSCAHQWWRCNPALIGKGLPPTLWASQRRSLRVTQSEWYKRYSIRASRSPKWGILHLGRSWSRHDHSIRGPPHLSLPLK